jgi:hypothetical protein
MRITEERYLVLREPDPLTAGFNSRTPLRTSTRKARLFGCACCRRVWEWLGPDVNRAAVEAAERAADGLMRIKDLHPFSNATRDVHVPLQRWPKARANPARQAASPSPWPPW